MRFKKYSYLSFIVSLSALLSCNNDDSSSNSQPEGEVSLVQVYGGTKNDSGQSVVATLDGGYAILGYTQSNDGDITDKQDESFDYWLLKFNVENELQWQKTYGGSADERGNDIIQTEM
jgi:hypothetical protein